MTSSDLRVDPYALRCTAVQFEKYAEQLDGIVTVHGPALRVVPAARDEVSVGVARSATAGADRFISEMRTGARELRAIAVALRTHADDVGGVDERLAAGMRL